MRILSIATVTFFGFMIVLTYAMGYRLNWAEVGTTLAYFAIFMAIVGGYRAIRPRLTPKPI